MSSIDFFTMDVSFRENGNESFSSAIGVLISLVIVFIVSVYGFGKFKQMSEYDESIY